MSLKAFSKACGFDSVPEALVCKAICSVRHPGLLLLGSCKMHIPGVDPAPVSCRAASEMLSEQMFLPSPPLVCSSWPGAVRPKLGVESFFLAFVL